MVKRIDILSHTSNPMRVILVPAGEPIPNHPGVKIEDKALIEFYDSRYPHTPDGQFITRYYLETLQNNNRNAGLILDGGVDDWRIDARTQNMVLDWAAYHTYPKP
jgi:hypothetical protein